MLKKRKSIFAMAVLMATLTACAGSGAAKTTEAPKPDDKAPVASAPAANASQEIKFAVWDNTTTDYWQKVATAFETANPGKTVKIVDIPSADYLDKMTIMMSSGDDTDVITIKTMPQLAGLAGKGQILPITDYIKKDNVDLAPYSGVMEDIKVNGNDYVLPFRNDIWVLYYNKGIFDKAGIPYPTSELTWEGYRELAKKLTTGTGNDKVYGAYTHTWTSNVANLMLPESGITLSDGTYDFLKPGYELLLGMQNDDKTTMEWGSLKTANVHYSGPFYKEQVAMLPMGSWFINSIINTKAKGETNVDWGFTSFPHWEGKESGNTTGTVTSFGINKNSKNPDLAWEFIKFACGIDGAKVLAEIGVKPGYTSTEILDLLSAVKGFPVECKDALNVKSITMEDVPRDKSAAIVVVVEEEHQLIMLGANSIDDGIASMNKRVAEILKK